MIRLKKIRPARPNKMKQMSDICGRCFSSSFIWMSVDILASIALEPLSGTLSSSSRLMASLLPMVNRMSMLLRTCSNIHVVSMRMPMTVPLMAKNAQIDYVIWIVCGMATIPQPTTFDRMLSVHPSRPNLVF